MDTRADPLRVLIVIENMSFTFDTRVKNIARTLERNGCKVWVVSPRYPRDPWKRVDGGITSWHYPLPPMPDGAMGHVLEYVWSFMCIGWLSLFALLFKRVEVLHVCNPPDIFFPLGRLYRMFGRKFVFDQHDLCPELWQVRYGRTGFMHKVLLTFERYTLHTANHVISTSETSRQRICARAPLAHDDVTLVRNGPNLANFPAPSAATEPVGYVEVGYIGDMNPQDGIDYLINAAHYIHNDLGRKDVRFVLIGDGGAWESLKKQAEELKLTDVIQFTGRMKPQDAMPRLAKTTLCVLPDPKNPFNDSCVMVKSLEYMALCKPVVSFDLTETRRICGDAALYAQNNDHRDLAAQILRLADDADLRRKLGAIGRQRVEQGLAWSFSEQQLLKAYGRLQRRKKLSERDSSSTESI